MSINWVMLTRDGKIVPMPNETIRCTSRPRVSLDITTPRELGVAEPFTLKCSDGKAFITNERVIYLPARPTETFKSFFTPVLNMTDTYAKSPMIGSWHWGGIVKPVSGGGIPMHIPRVSVRFTFKDGGHSEFQAEFERIKERLHHAREMGLNPGQHFDAPPPYEPDAPGASAPAGPAQVDSQPRQQQPSLPTPDEPPPDYVEAQAQAISMQYEERMREEAEREGPARNGDEREGAEREEPERR